MWTIRGAGAALTLLGTAAAVYAVDLYSHALVHAESLRPVQELQESPEESVEPRSGASVPQRLTVAQNTAPLPLIGTSVRTVTVFGFLTYTLAFYADRRDVTRAWQSASSSQAALVPTGATSTPANASSLSEQALAKLVDTAQHPRSLRIVNYRKIDSAHFCQSLHAGLLDRWRRAGLDVAQLDAINATFRSFFKTKDLPPGTKIDFTFHKGSLTLFVNGYHMGTIAESRYATEFLAMFIGERARAPGMRSDLANSLEKTIQTE